MPRAVEDLIGVQRLDLRILKLEKELRDIPERKQLISQRNNALKQSLQSEKESAKSAQARAAELELDARAEQEKIAKLRMQQMQLKSNKEFKAMEDEIATFERRAGEVDDKQIEALEQVEKLEGRVREVEADLKNAEAGMQRSAQELDARVGDIEAELSTVRQERDRAAAVVDPAWLKTYRRIFENKKDAVVVSAEHGFCAGCNLKLPPHIIHDARQGDNLVKCPFCRRLLY